MNKKYIIEIVYSESLRKLFKLTVKEDNKIIESIVYKSLPRISKRIKEIQEKEK